MIKKVLASLFAAVGILITALIGKITWNTPPWIGYLHRNAVTKPRIFWGTLITILIGLGLIFFGYHWYQSWPQPERVTAQITPPKLTPIAKTLVPDQLAIDFGVITNGEFRNKPVAPLKLVGKEVKDGITISPAKPGKWVWETDSHLIFTPSTDWPAGQTYTINFTKNFFASKTKMAKLTYSFTTLPFEGLITEFKFYQDPLNPQTRQAVATINFSYPVDAESLEKNIYLAYPAVENGKVNLKAQTIKHTLNYDEHKRIAYLRSEPLLLPQVSRDLQLTVSKGVKPIEGPAVTTDELKAKLVVPDAGSYFKVTKTNSQIVRNEKDQPEQVLTVETTLGITQAALNKSLHVYLLPRDLPATQTDEAKPDYPWKDPGEVTDKILAISKQLDIQTIPADRDYATLHSFKYRAPTPGFIFVKIDKGTSAFGGYTLENNYAAVFPIPEIPQEITFLHKGALLALGTEEKLSVLVRGVAAVKFNFARVLAGDVNHLITQTGGDFSNPYFIDPNFNQDNISEIFSQVQNFNATDPAKEQYTALDLSKYLSASNLTGKPLGLFLLQARGWDTQKNLPLDVKANRLVLITDLGLVVKDNIDGTHDIFVQSITNGTPVPNASVAILGKNGLPILTHATDGQGHASFPTLKDFANEREPTVYLVRNGNDVSFIPYNRVDRQLNFSRFDVGGITNNSENQAALTAYLFSDRGIYRPGDTAHIAMIVKQPFAMPQPAGLPLEATIVDPRGVTIKEEKITLNASGYLTFDFQTTPTSATGQYLVYLYIVKDNHPSSVIGSATIHVAEFLPDRMRITVHLSKEQTQGWISPSELTAKVSLWNLYGAPAANHRVSGKILLTPHVVTFKEFPDFTFLDPLLDPKTPPKVFTDTLADIQTDKEGQATFDLKLNRFEKATYELTFFAEGFEAEGGRSVTTQTTSLVSPLAYLIGYKPDGDLSYIKQNSTRSVRFIAVNPQLTQQSLSNLTLHILSQHPVTTLIKRDDGTYQYQSLMQTTPVSTQAFSITTQGTDYALPAQTIGDFVVFITDQSGIELSRFNYSIVGTSQQPLPKNAELSVKLNKTEYAPGEDIEMQITAPYTGAGLITIERDKVHAYQWFKTNSTTSVQKIRLPNDFQGGGYVNVTFVRDLNSPEIFMTPLSYSVVPFSVTHTNREVKVDLTVPELARPGDALTISYRTDKKSKIIVFAVDEGILQVTKYQTPNPLNFFFQKHALEVNTLQIVDQILPKFIAQRELSAVGGDRGEALLSRNLNPFKRKSEAPVVYWSGILDADQTSRQVTYQIPDYFNGTLRVMAVAVAADAVGSSAKSTEVRGHFVINPNVPTFVAPNDEFDVSASIANNVEGSGDASVAIELTSTPQLEIIGSAKQNLTIPEGQERSIHFKLRAKSQLGSAMLNFNALLGDKSSKTSMTTSVRPAMPYVTSIVSGYTEEANKSLTLDRILYPEYRSVEAAVSPSPLILVAGLQHYLDDYPYGCTEQLVSKGFPLLAMANQPWFATDIKSINERIQQVIQILSLRQMTGGGFNYWPNMDSSQGNDFASVYALHFLTEARAQGYIVPSDVFSSGIGYLKDLATQEINNLEQARIQAYAIYILTRNEIVTTNYLTGLQLALDQHPNFDWHHDITSVYIAATYQLLKSTADANRLIDYYKPLAKQENGLTDFYNQPIADAQYLYLIAKHFPERLMKLDNKLIISMADALNNDTMNTVLSGYTSLALATYGQFHSETSAGSLILNAVVDGKPTPLTSTTDIYQQAKISENAQQITITNAAKQGYFYQLVQAGFNKDLPKEATYQGIEVYREYRNADNTVISSAALGEEIFVHIRVRAVDNQYHSNVALIDLLPGGFEVVRDSVKVQNIDYADVREDRVIFFSSVAPDSFEIVYRIKATNIGNYVVPPMLATSMYNPLIKSLGVASNITVQEAN